tara:strand:- start:1785 stop:2051 length:267 start_codon:yes stop_codon:yes gene_type:complete
MNIEQLNTSFEMACNLIKTITQNVQNNDLLELYGYYKQATQGDCNTIQPSYFNFKEYKKWEAWKQNLGKDQNNMKLLYINKVKSLMNK